MLGRDVQVGQTAERAPRGPREGESHRFVVVFDDEGKTGRDDLRDLTLLLIVVDDGVSRRRHLVLEREPEPLERRQVGFARRADNHPCSLIPARSMCAATFRQAPKRSPIFRTSGSLSMSPSP